MKSQNRKIHPMGWLVASLFFPCGIFIAFSYAKLISWTKGILLAIIAYAFTVGFALSMGSVPEESLSQNILLVVGFVIFIVVGYFQYKIGSKVSYWSDKGKRIWKMFGVLSIVLLVLVLISIPLTIVLKNMNNQI